MSWRDLARRRDFRRLWLGDAISLLGDWLTYVAVGMLALREGEGLLAVALVLVAHTLPRALLAPLAGRLADRLDRRAIMVIASLVRAAVVIAMAIAAEAGALGAVSALLFVRMAVGAFIEPAASAALPLLVPRAAIGPANALLGATWSVVFALGVALGGLVTAALGPVGALALDALTFVIAAGILATLPRLRPDDMPIWSCPDGHVNEGATSAASPADQGRLADAWALAWRERPILEAALARVPAMLVGGGAWVLVHAIAGRAAVAGAALALGALHGARAIGTGIGPLLWARAPALASTRLGLHASVLLCLVAVALLALADAPAWVVAASLLWGIAGGANWVSTATRLQLLTPSRALGRVASIDLLTYSLAQCVGGVGGALLAEHLAAPRAAAWVGVGAGALAWIALLALGGGWRGRASRG